MVATVQYPYKYGDRLFPHTEREPKKGITLSRWAHTDLRRPVAESLGPVWTGVAMPKCDPRDPSTVAAGMLYRLAREVPKRDHKLFYEFWQWTYARHRRLYVPLEPTCDLSFETALASSSYTEKEKQLFRDALLNAPPFSAVEIREKWAGKCFVKDEAYADFKHARIITGRDDFVAAYVMPLHTQIERAIFQRATFIKKIPVHLRPEYLRGQYSGEREGLPGAVEGDDSVFQHLLEYFIGDFESYESLIELVYVSDVPEYHPEDPRWYCFRAPACFGKAPGGGPRWLLPGLQTACEKDLFDWMTSRLVGLATDPVEEPSYVEKVREFSYPRPGVRAKFEAKQLAAMLSPSVRNSGDRQTSWGNGTTTDDVTTFLKEKHPDRKLVDQDFADLGLACKSKYTDVPGEATFCGLTYHDHDRQAVRDPRPVLAKLGWSKLTYVGAGPTTKLFLMYMKGLSLTYEMPQCPVLGAVGRSIVRQLQWTYTPQRYRRFISGLNSYERSTYDKILQSTPGSFAPTLGTRQLVERLYDIPVPKQLALEAQLDAHDWREPFSIDLDVPKPWTDCWQEYVMPNCGSVELWGADVPRYHIHSKTDQPIPTPEFTYRVVGPRLPAKM